MRRTLGAGALVTALIYAAAALAAASPAVTPGTVNGIGDTVAVLNGTVNPNGEATTYQFDWGLTPSLGNVSPAVPASAGAGTVAVAESAKLTGLSPDTTYYYELRASNGSGASSTPAEPFKTTGNPAPTSTTNNATYVDRYAATLVGTVNPGGAATSYYFQYGLTSNYLFQTNVQSLPAGASPVTVTYALPGIEPGTVFHYRLVATHGGTSTTYGSDVTFETAPFPRAATHFTFGAAAQSGRHFVGRGRIILPYTTPSSYGCQGDVRVRYYLGGRLRQTSYVPVGLDCIYAANAHIGGVPIGTVVTVRAHYLGDLYDGPSGIKSAQVVAR